MLNFAANLSLMYTEHPFLERFAAAARDGFRGVEFLFPYQESPTRLRACLDDTGLKQVLFNAPPGDFAKGERGLAAVPGRRAEFRHGIEQALEYAQALSCTRVHVMAGCLAADQTREAYAACYQDNLAWAATQAASVGVTLLIEPINTRDMPGYFLNYQHEAHALVQAIGSEFLKVQMDLYHCQITEGDVGTKLRQYLPTGRVAHLQIAGVPQRQEPNAGELNYQYLFGILEELGYGDWIGCEYRPAAGTQAGLGWLRLS